MCTDGYRFRQLREKGILTSETGTNGGSGNNGDGGSHLKGAHQGGTGRASQTSDSDSKKDHPKQVRVKEQDHTKEFLVKQEDADTSSPAPLDAGLKVEETNANESSAAHIKREGDEAEVKVKSEKMEEGGIRKKEEDDTKLESNKKIVTKSG